MVKLLIFLDIVFIKMRFRVILMHYCNIFIRVVSICIHFILSAVIFNWFYF